ncbi:MAG: MarR family winged helix-turn-helix transcriptional regulator, partial [Calditrichia bacterium]
EIKCLYTPNMNSNKTTRSKKRSEIVQNCTCFNLRKANRAVTSLFDEALKPCGLYATQFTLLAAISSREPVTITKLSKALIMDRTTLTRNLNPLQKSGWVEVTPGEDKRTRTLSLTRSGKKVLKNALTYWSQVQNQVVKTLGKGNWEELLENLSLAVKKLSPY